MTRRTSIVVAVLCVLTAAVHATLALLRYATFHNETFDLAFYARMAWGLAGANFWDPILNASVFGLHLSPVLLPLGLLGRIVGTVPVLLITQAAALSAAAWPLAQMGARRLGTAGAIGATLAMLLYPNVSHVASFEFHPGTVAVLPLALAVDAIDRKSARAFAWSVIGVLACREDLALVTAILGAIAWRGVPELRPVAKRVIVGSLAWLAIFVVVLHPLLAPENGSLEAHFGKWGGSLGEVVLTWVTDPFAVAAHLGEPHRLAYVPLILMPVGLIPPLLSPRWLLAIAPGVAINLMSDFPSTLDIESHYMTPAVPLIVASAVEGVGRFAQRRGSIAWRVVASGALALPAVVAHVAAGGTPIAARYPAEAFRSDERTEAARRVVERIPDGVSVQAPYALMPHLAERENIHRVPPPDMRADFVVFDLWHRERWRGNESLVRTSEEPNVRAWIGRRDFAMVYDRAPYVILQRGADPDRAVGRRYVVGFATPETRITRLCACFGVARAQRAGGDRVALDLVVTGQCANDLSLRLGTTEKRPRRVELMFDGLLATSHLREGEIVRSTHTIPGLGDARSIRVGAMRSSGARPAPEDPISVAVPLEGE